MEIEKQIEKDAYSIKFLARRNDKVVAWAYLFILKTDRHDEPYGVMENVYVEQEYRGQGIGTELVKEIIATAKEKGCYKLLGQSRYGKEKVHDLYIGFGFKDHGKNFRIDLLESKENQRD